MFSLLHIDHNFFYREIIHKLSVEKDFRYYSAKSPEKAYEILKQQPIDVIVTSLEFKDEKEVFFIKHLMALKPIDAVLIVLSANDDEKLNVKLYELGITEFIKKENFLQYLKNYIIRLEANKLIVTKLKLFKIALLDDDEIHLNQMNRMLKNQGIYNTTLFNHPKELLLSEERFQIYLVDFVLPDLSGEEVILTLRSRDEYAVIIAMSSLMDQSVISDLLMSGADDFIHKPFSETVFIARLKASTRTFSLLDQLKEKNERLLKMSVEDGLTGLFNHRYIMELLSVEIDRARRTSTAFSILMFDLDHFKHVNDTYGHHMGDVVLSEIGALWVNEGRKIDIPGRYGGEEFIVLLPNTTHEGALIYANKLCRRIEGMSFGNEGIRVTMSGGIATYTAESPLQLVKLADERLYQAKKSGRNRIES